MKGPDHDSRPFHCEGRRTRRAGDSLPFRDGAGGSPAAEEAGDGRDPLPLELHVVRDGVCWKVDLSICVIEGEPYTQEWWSNVIWVANYFLDESVQDEA
jgi:hypothetical protein